MLRTLEEVEKDIEALEHTLEMNDPHEAPENFYCDGELSVEEAQRRYQGWQIRLNELRREREKLEKKVFLVFDHGKYEIRGLTLMCTTIRTRGKHVILSDAVRIARENGCKFLGWDGTIPISKEISLGAENQVV